MTIHKLSLKTSGDVYGYKARLVSKDGAIEIDAGKKVSYDPESKLISRLSEGFLFRNPEMKQEQFSDIWDAIEYCEDKVKLSVDYDDVSKKICCYLKFKSQNDATAFILSSDSFEKWSDSMTKAEKASKPLKGKMNKDGTVRVTVTVESLGD